MDNNMNTPYDWKATQMVTGMEATTDVSLLKKITLILTCWRNYCWCKSVGKANIDVSLLKANYYINLLVKLTLCLPVRDTLLSAWGRG